MNRILFGMTVGAIAGIIAYKKVGESKAAEKMIKKAHKKLCDD